MISIPLLPLRLVVLACVPGGVMMLTTVPPLPPGVATANGCRDFDFLSLLFPNKENPQDLTIRSEVDVGPPKVRKRYTAGIVIFSGLVYRMTKANVATFQTFYVTTINGGATAFDLPHPRTAATVSARITSAPTYTALSDDIFDIAVDMEVLP